jgi:hypothetical protein
MEILINSSLQEDTRAFVRAAIVNILNKENKTISLPKKHTLTTEDFASVYEITDFLDMRTLPFTKSVLCAELGLDLDTLRLARPRGHAEITRPGVSPKVIETNEAAVVESHGKIGEKGLLTSSEALDRRERILELQSQELKMRETTLQREKEWLEKEKTKMQEWRKAEAERFAQEIDQMKQNLACELEKERDNLINERLKLSAELSRIKQLFPQ